MINCPSCEKEVNEDFGMVTCPYCKAVFMIDYGGKIQYGTEESPVEETNVSDSFREDEEEIVEETSSGSEFLYPNPIEDEPVDDEETTANDVEDFLQEDEFTPTETEDDDEIESSDEDFISDFQSDLEDEGEVEEEVQEDIEEEAEEEPVDDLVDDETPEEDNDFFEATEVSEKALAPNNEPVDITEFANSEESLLEGGEFLYTLTISRIDSKDLRDDLKYVLMDEKLKLNYHEHLKNIVDGCVSIPDLHPIKAKRIVEQLQFFDLEVRWEQKRVIMEDATEEEVVYEDSMDED